VKRPGPLVPHVNLMLWYVTSGDPVGIAKTLTLPAAGLSIPRIAGLSRCSVVTGLFAGLHRRFRMMTPKIRS
jgi:hypothetical protein